MLAAKTGPHPATPFCLLIFLFPSSVPGQEPFPWPHTDILWPCLGLQVAQGGAGPPAEKYWYPQSPSEYLAGQWLLSLGALLYVQQPGKSQEAGMYLKQALHPLPGYFFFFTFIFVLRER